MKVQLEKENTVTIESGNEVFTIQFNQFPDRNVLHVYANKNVTASSQQRTDKYDALSEHICLTWDKSK